MVERKKISYYLLIVLLIIMPIHTLVFSHLLKNFKILSLLRDVIIVALVANTFNRKLKKKMPDILIFISVIVIVAFSLTNISGASFNTMRRYCVPLLIYYFSRNIQLNEKEKDKLIWVAWWMCVLIAIWGLLQAFVLGPEILFKIGYSNNGYMFTSAAFYINHWYQQRVIGLLATFSRSAWVGCAISLLLGFKMTSLKINKINKKIIGYILLIVFGAIFVIIAAGKIDIIVTVFDMFTNHFLRTIKMQDASFNRHLLHLFEPITIVIENPFGLGFATNGATALAHLPVELTHQVESSIWVMAYELGLIGMLLYYMPYIYGFLFCFKYKKYSIAKCSMRILVCTMLVFLLLPSVQNFEHPFYVMLTLGFAQQSIEKIKRQKENRICVE